MLRNTNTAPRLNTLPTELTIMIAHGLTITDLKTFRGIARSFARATWELFIDRCFAELKVTFSLAGLEKLQKVTSDPDIARRIVKVEIALGSITRSVLEEKDVLYESLLEGFSALSTRSTQSTLRRIRVSCVKKTKGRQDRIARRRMGEVVNLVLHAAAETDISTEQLVLEGSPHSSPECLANITSPQYVRFRSWWTNLKSLHISFNREFSQPITDVFVGMSNLDALTIAAPGHVNKFVIGAHNLRSLQLIGHFDWGSTCLLLAQNKNSLKRLALRGFCIHNPPTADGTLIGFFDWIRKTLKLDDFYMMKYIEAVQFIGLQREVRSLYVEEPVDHAHIESLQTAKERLDFIVEHGSEDVES